MLDQVFASIESRRTQAIVELKEFLRIPSVSAKPEHKPDMQCCASWLAGQLRGIGLSASIEATAGHPIVLARNEHKPGRRTVLVYGHYDVQPPEPLDLWTTPPFEPTERNGAIYARGSADDKGQVWAHVEAIRAWQAAGGLPVNLIMLIEGEEEFASDNLEAFLRQRAGELRADIAIVSDTSLFARGKPAITYGLRGLAYSEVFITGPSHDLHSGSWRGSVPNAANVLCELLATLHDKDGRVNLPGFYDDVVPISPQERATLAALPFDEPGFLSELKLAAPVGEAGYTTLERQWARPTCDINGLTSGYQGPKEKTVIPAKASAKVSMRLVPNQDPRKIQALFKRTMIERCPGTVKIEVADYGAAAPVIVPLDSRPMKLAATAIEKGFGVAPLYMRAGGTIPVVAQMKTILGLSTLLVGFGLPDDCLHAPNEKFDLDCLYRGTRTAAALYEQAVQL